MIFIICTIISLIIFVLSISSGTIELSILWGCSTILYGSLAIMHERIKELRKELTRFKTQFENNKNEMRQDIERLKTKQTDIQKQLLKKDKE
jgi:uncharacterized membrane protein (DUF106 family)